MPGELYMALRSGTVRTVEDSLSRIKGRRTTVLTTPDGPTGKLPFPADRLPKE